MNLFPYKRMTLRTRMAPEEVAARLTKIVAVGRPFFTRPPEPFTGCISGRHFKIARVLRKPFRKYPPYSPVVIVGDIVSAPEGTEVRVRLRLQALLAVVMTMWFGYFAVMLLRSGLRDGFGPYARGGREFPGPGVGLVFVGGMVLGAYALICFVFWAEVKEASTLLRERLGCREVDERGAATPRPRSPRPS